MRWLVAGALVASALSLPAPPLLASAEEVLDRIVAVVDDDPVFRSDLRRAIALGQMAPAAGESADEFERRVLDGLIDQRLRLHAVERYDLGPLPVDELERQVAAVRGRYPDPAAYQAALRELGLDEERLRHLLARQLRVLVYVEERLGPRIFIDRDEVRAYYEGELARKAAAEGVELPALDAVRDEIRALLYEIKLNQEIDAWTEELRKEAEVRDFLERPETELPPVVERYEIDG